MTDATDRSSQIVAELDADFTGNDHHLASEYEWRATMELLAWIHDHGDTFDPDELQQRSLQDGWSPQGARKLKQIAHNIIDGKRIRFRQRPGQSGEHWHRAYLEALLERRE